MQSNTFSNTHRLRRFAKLKYRRSQISPPLRVLAVSILSYNKFYLTNEEALAVYYTIKTRRLRAFENTTNQSAHRVLSI